MDIKIILIVMFLGNVISFLLGVALANVKDKKPVTVHVDLKEEILSRI